MEDKISHVDKEKNLIWMVTEEGLLYCKCGSLMSNEESSNRASNDKTGV